jgi:hypothetical protein
MNRKISIQAISMKLITGAFALGITSCERVIEVDLNETRSKIVVDGGISDRGPGSDTLILSRTGSYFGGNDFSAITGASVTISDDQGNSDALKEVAAGRYVTQKLNGVPGRTYHLNIKAEGKTYSAISKMQGRVNIDRLLSRYRERSLGTREGTYVSVVFTDPGHEQNYYMIRANGRYIRYNQGSEAFFVFSDEMFNGSQTVIEIPFCHFDRGSANIELISIGKAAFDYFSSLNEVILNPGPNAFSGTPQYPTNNNINGDALGYFSAFPVSTATIRIGN